MAESELQDRLRHHAEAFDGLLSLIPAKMYYGEDAIVCFSPVFSDEEAYLVAGGYRPVHAQRTATPPREITGGGKGDELVETQNAYTTPTQDHPGPEDQFRKTKKKKSSAEKKAAKQDKLDPDSELNRNAKEVLEERARNKRKLLDREDDDKWEDIEGIEREKPRQGLKSTPAKTNKKQKLDGAAEDNVQKTPRRLQMEAKKSKRKEKAIKQLEQRMAKRDFKTQTTGQDAPAPNTRQKEEPKHALHGVKSNNPVSGIPSAEVEDWTNHPDNEKHVSAPGYGRSDDKGTSPAIHRDISNQEAQPDDGAPSPPSTSHSPIFDLDNATPSAAAAEAASTTTSISSAVDLPEKPKYIKVPEDTTAFRERFAARLAALRASRKVDGPDGKPIRTRQELIEARREKQAQRKAHKKELRRQSKLDEELRREEALASNSPSVMSPNIDVDDLPNFTFGRVAFGDGAQLSNDLTRAFQPRRQKGPSDPKTALTKLQNEKKRIAEMDTSARTEKQEKETWLTARRRAEGQKVRDDEALLKKAVKRKENKKKKTEKEWKERVSGVESAMKAKQKKREENIKKRKEDKLLGRAGKKKGMPKKKARPGFEGRFGGGGLAGGKRK